MRKLISIKPNKSNKSNKSIPTLSVDQLLQRKQLLLDKAKFEELAILKPVKVAVFDRNFGDVMSKHFGKAPIAAKKLLNDSHWVISRLPVDPNFTSLGKAPWCLVSDPRIYNGKQHVFCLEVSYKPGHWYPLDTQGTLPAKDAQMGTVLLGRPTTYASMPGKTELGWRGNMILWDDLPDCNLYMD